MKFVPVSGALGAEVTDVDLRALSDDELSELRAGLHDNEVVFIRGAHLTDEEHLALGARFGTVNIFPLARVRGATAPVTTTIRDIPGRRIATDHWHTDVTYAAQPPDYAFLQAEVVPERGGDTLWASTTSAFDALSPVMQDLLLGLRVEHDAEGFLAGVRASGAGGSSTADLEGAFRSAYPPVAHPLVRVHPATGRRALFLGGSFMSRIQGMNAEESALLLTFLNRHIEDPRFHCRWRWQAGDLAIWDERSTNHRSAGDHFPQARALRRIEVGGSTPVGVG